MHAIHTACAMAIVASTLAAQGSGSRGRTSRQLAPQYPTEARFYEFSPFVDKGGQPLRAAAQAAGAADFDGDGNRDLWFLGGQKGPNAPGQIAVQFANTAGVGRFYRRDPLPTSKYIAAANYHTTTSPVDQLLVVDPSLDEPVLLHWDTKRVKGDPRDGHLSGAVSGWKIGKNVTEIATADHSRDGHDDIVVLQTLPAFQTAIHKLVMNTASQSFLAVEETLTAVLPGGLQQLRLLDLDGDKRTDFVAVWPAVGVIACRDNALGGFDMFRFWPLYGTRAVDVTTGDLDGNGRDDIALCFGDGIVVALSQPTGNPKTARFTYRLFMNPKGVGNLARCCVIDGNAKGSMLVVGMPRGGQNYVIHPFNPGFFGLARPWVEPAPGSFVGKGVIGESLIVTDVDNDGDPDLVVQTPAGDAWTTLRNPAVSFAPNSLSVEDQGSAPIGEGPTSRRVQLRVLLPQALIDAGVQKAEIAFFVIDPASPNALDPDYLYWGRVTPTIDKQSRTASFRVFYDTNPKSFTSRVADYKKKRTLKLSHAAIVYPQEPGTIRGGPGCFMSIHGVSSGSRYESGNGDPTPPENPPKSSGSASGGKWNLKANPPSPKGDIELLPWE